MSIRSALRNTFGFTKFRPNQQEIVRATVGGRDVFAVMPTGGGKSLCYQLPALVLPGLTVVISPLVALMKDQVDAARATGIPAACLNSTLPAQETQSVYQQLAAGTLRLLYISPERFALDHFVAQLEGFGVARFAVDEAHCLSEWGHDFRPDYLSLASIRDAFPEAPIAAFTATATIKVQRDIVNLLRLQEPLMVRASFDRPELRYQVRPKEDASGQIIRFVKERQGESGIIYHGSRAGTEKTALLLQKSGVRALPYHAGLEKETRSEYQELFNRDEIEVIVATIAFGMGIDKSNVRFVIHADLPRSIEGYYQETGRAGRDGEPADCLLLFSRGDISKTRYHIQRMENPDEKRRAERNLQTMVTYASTNACRRRQLLEYFEEEYPGECGNCDVCHGEVRVADATEDARKLLSAVARTGERFGAVHVVDVVRGADTDKIRKFRHDRLPTYGVGSDRDKQWWRNLTDELVAQKYLLRDSERFNALVITDEGRGLLYGRSSFEATVREEKKAVRQKDIDGVTWYESKDLFKKLKELRRRMASERGVPPYVVFSDKTLREMAAIKPESTEELLGVTGVGDYKLEHFGREFLEEIRSFTED
jgi:ATP-dependent DNA helicase RecQ